MINETTMKKMNELLENEEIAQEVQNATVKESYDVLVRNGLEMSFEEYESILADCRTMLKENGHLSDDGEISEELLNLINGGAKVYHCPWCSKSSTNYWSVYGHAIVHAAQKGYFDLPIWMIKKALLG